MDKDNKKLVVQTENNNAQAISQAITDHGSTILLMKPKERSCRRNISQLLREGLKMAGMLAICRKELADHLGSKRFLLLAGLIIVLSLLSAYQGSEYVREGSQRAFIEVISGQHELFPCRNHVLFRTHYWLILRL